MRTFILLLLCLCWLPAPVYSGEEADQNVKEKAAFFMKTSNDLYTLCTLDKQHPLYEKGTAFCFGFVSGAMSFYGAIAPSPKTPQLICAEKDIPRKEMVQTFIQWYEQNSEAREHSPIDGLVKAAMEKWPCPTEK